MGRTSSGHALPAPTNHVALALWEAKREHEREQAAQLLAASAANSQLPPLPLLPQQPQQYSPAPSANPYERGYSSGGAARGTRRSRGGVEFDEEASSASPLPLPLPVPSSADAAPATSSPAPSKAKGKGRATRASGRGRASETPMDEDVVMGE